MDNTGIPTGCQKSEFQKMYPKDSIHFFFLDNLKNDD